MKQYIVDAFTDKPFSGNPAAVCVMDSWPSEESMMKLAMENNLSETAFIVKEESGYHLRWFTPGTEVELCGHATLASSYVILTFCEPESSEVRFNTLSGVLTVRKKGDLYEMDFPTYPLTEIPVTDEMGQAFGIRPVKAVLGLDLICVFENEEQVRSMQPDQTRLKNLEGRIQNATAKGTEADCVSRSFCPKLSIAEDPVCGSAHCQIADYWSGELNKKQITAYQASKRGGYLYCELREDGRINISGKAALVGITDIVAELQSGRLTGKKRDSKRMKLDRSFVFKKFKNELAAKYGPKKAVAIWRYAGHVLQKLEAAEPDADKNSRSFVFPAVALYRAVGHYAPDEALTVTRAYGTKTGIRMRNISVR